MKSILVIVFTLAIVFPSLSQDSYKYVGISTCKMCHKSDKSGNQFKIWEQSAHSKAYKTLLSAKAKDIAKKKGMKNAPHEVLECLKCHTTGSGLNQSKFGEKFKIEEGVQCEECHGAGSEYKTKEVMKDRQKAVENGMKLVLVKNGSVEKLCKKCHNEESPSYKKFVFTEFWEKIKHPVK